LFDGGEYILLRCGLLSTALRAAPGLFAMHAIIALRRFAKKTEKSQMQ